MKKFEFIKNLELEGEIIDIPKLEEIRENGDKLYRVTRRKKDIVLLKIEYEHVYFYVINEGKEMEETYSFECK